jgi:hypothetical protein
MAIGRPYIQLSLDALKAKLSDTPGNRVLLEEVQHELAFRTTPGARRLEREVLTLLEGLDTDAKASKKASKKASEVPTTTPCDSEGSAPPTGAPSSTLESRYLALRATFTAEAEILARWGLTSLAPPRLRDAAFRCWQEIFNSGGQHPLGLGRDDLERDLESLKNEKRGT